MRLVAVPFPVPDGVAVAGAEPLATGALALGCFELGFLSPSLDLEQKDVAEGVCNTSVVD
jgi:hypothetical protein